MGDSLKLSFGMIVLNGEPFTRYNLRSLYPHAHQIIVVEGACPSARGVATPDGHSTDGTMEVLRAFKRNEDPEDKIIIVTAQDEGHPNGFWQEKDEMSKAYARRATGNYLWQVDSDEFYHEGQVSKIKKILVQDRPDAVSFPMLTFWGSINYIVDSFYLIRDNAREYHRLFAWRPGYSYATHFPPTVLDEGGVDVRSKKWLRADQLENKGIYLYHYSLLFPHQVYNKVSYYRARENNAIDTWEDMVYRRLEKPFRAHNVYQSIGWLQRFSGQHPLNVINMMADIEAGRVDIERRNCADVERLFSKPWYSFSCRVLSMCARLMSFPPLRNTYYKYMGFRNRVHRLFVGQRGRGAV